METHVTQVNEKLQLILMSRVINSLTQHVWQTNSAPQRPLLLGTTDDNLDSQLKAVPSVPPSTSNIEVLSQSLRQSVSQDTNPEVLQQGDVPVEGNEVEITNASVEIVNTTIESGGEPGLLTSANVQSIFRKFVSQKENLVHYQLPPMSTMNWLWEY